MRSSVVPQTIASETAQKTNWNRNLAGTTASENDIAGNRLLSVVPRNVPCVPANQPDPPNASAKPTAQYQSDATDRLARTLGTTVPAFFIREKPTSSRRKP